MVKRRATTSDRLRTAAYRLVAPLGVVVAVLAVRLLIDFTRGEVIRAVVVGAMFVIAVVLGMRIRHRSRHDISDRRHDVSQAIVVMWVVVTVGPLHTIARRSIHDAVSSPGTDALVEIVAYAAIAAVCIGLLREILPDVMELRPPVPFLVFPMVAAASAAWSSIARYSFGKGAQLLILALLAVTTLAFARRGGDVERVFGGYLRGVAALAFVLVIARVVIGPVYITATGENLDRFSLIGMHPNLSAFFVGLALFIVIATPARLLRAPPVARVAAVAVFVAALLPMQSRTSMATLAAGLGAMFVLAIHRNDHLRIRVLPAAVTFVLAGALLFRQDLASYVLRGGSSDTLTGGNGRIGLWKPFLSELRTPFDALFGLGYGQAKVVLIGELPWATTAHNSVLSVTVGLGLVGLGSYLLLLAHGGASIFRSNLIRTDLGPLLLGLVAMLVAQMGASDAIAEPAGGLALLYLLIVVAIAATEARTTDERVAADGQGTGPSINSTAAARSRGSSISTQAGEATGAAP